MNNIKDAKKAEVVMGRFEPCDLAIIEDLEFKSSFEHSSTNLLVRALFQPRANNWPDFEKQMFRVVIVFDGVRGLKLKDFGGGPTQIMGFDINFIGDRGLEGINYVIEDYENDRIKFSCLNVSVQSCESVVRI